MNWKAITKLVIVLSIIVLFLYDWLTIEYGGYDTSISHTLYTMAQEFPVVAFGFGFLMGHLFWPQSINGKTNNNY